MSATYYKIKEEDLPMQVIESRIKNEEGSKKYCWTSNRVDSLREARELKLMLQAKMERDQALKDARARKLHRQMLALEKEATSKKESDGYWPEKTYSTDMHG